MNSVSHTPGAVSDLVATSARSTVEPRRIGQVIDEEGRPVTTARIEFYSQPLSVLRNDSRSFARCTVDTDGKFEIPLEPRVAALMIDASGYEELSHDLGADESPTLTLLRRTRDLVLRGSVRGADGTPLSRFELMAWTDARQLLNWTEVTSAGGTFEITVKVRRDAASSVVVLARGRGFVQARSDSLPFAATETTLGPIDFVLRPGIVVMGFIRDLADAPLADAHAQFLYEPGAYGPNARSGPDGSVEFTLDPNRKVVGLSISAANKAPLELFSDDVGGSWDGFIARLDGGVRIRGIVRDTTGAPISDATVHVWSEPAFGKGVTAYSSFSVLTGTDSNGSFQIEHAPRTPLLAVARTSSDGAIKDLTPIVPFAAQSRDEIEITLSAGNTLRVEGRIEIACMPTAALWVEWVSSATSEGPAAPSESEAVLARWRGTVGEPFTLIGPPIGTRVTRSRLRIRLSDDAHVDRPFELTGDHTVLEPIRFGPKDLHVFLPPGTPTPTAK